MPNGSQLADEGVEEHQAVKELLSEIDSARAMVVSEMESALRLDVPLVVDTAHGRRWSEAHA